MTWAQLFKANDVVTCSYHGVKTFIIYHVQRKDSFIEILNATRKAQKELYILQRNILVYFCDTS